MKSLHNNARMNWRSLKTTKSDACWCYWIFKKRQAKLKCNLCHVMDVPSVHFPQHHIQFTWRMKFGRNSFSPATALSNSCLSSRFPINGNFSLENQQFIVLQDAANISTMLWKQSTTAVKLSTSNIFEIFPLHSIINFFFYCFGTHSDN